MKLFYNSTESMWDVYTKTRYGLKKVASFSTDLEALEFINQSK